MRPSLLLLIGVALAACDARTPPGDSPGRSLALADPDFATLQIRGGSQQASTVDMHTSAHRFDDLPNGGRIQLQRMAEDSAGVQQIRAHLQHLARAFSRGDFRIPGSVYDRAEVPGTRVMADKRGLIHYTYSRLPRGGEVRIQSGDPEAVSAIHAFLAVQRGHRRAGGDDRHPRSSFDRTEGSDPLRGRAARWQALPRRQESDHGLEPAAGVSRTSAAADHSRARSP